MFAETGSSECSSRTFGENICPEKESCVLVLGGKINNLLNLCTFGFLVVD